LPPKAQYRGIAGLVKPEQVHIGRSQIDLERLRDVVDLDAGRPGHRAIDVEVELSALCAQGRTADSKKIGPVVTGPLNVLSGLLKLFQTRTGTVLANHLRAERVSHPGNRKRRQNADCAFRKVSRRNRSALQRRIAAVQSGRSRPARAFSNLAVLPYDGSFRSAVTRWQRLDGFRRHIASHQAIIRGMATPEFAR
jgi:hypothetical protein